MNIHPLFVHFPIGLLVVYSVLEIIAYAWPSIRRQVWLFPVNTFLLFVGAVGAFVALFTGGIAEDIIRHTSNYAYIIKVHSTFAAVTTILYIILAGAYLVRVFDRNGWGNRMAGLSSPFMRIWSFKKYLAHLILDTWALPVLALLALIGMTVTGALGAAIVYGPNADPFVTFIYHLFWAQ
jgi:uncharacterized membrane protein